MLAKRAFALVPGLIARARRAPVGVLSVHSVREALTLAPGEHADVQGWVRTVRAHKAVSFLELSDGTSMQPLQLVLDDLRDHVSVGAAVRARGTMKDTPRGKQRVELHCSHLQVVGECDASAYPLQKKFHTLEFLREVAHLRARTNVMGAMLRVRSAAALAIHSFFDARGYVQVHTPVLTSNDCEGAGETFSVAPAADVDEALKRARTGAPGEGDLSPEASLRSFFGRQAYLTVSGQLQAEMFACALSKVYTFGPTFRAENSNTPKHLAEFWMLEPEVAFADLQDVMQLAEDCVRSVGESVRSRCEQEVDFFAQRVDESVVARLDAICGGGRGAGPPYARMTYTEAVRELARETERRQRSGGEPFQFPVHWGASLQTEHERWLCETLCEGRPVFVTHYPATVKPFYMRAGGDPKAEGEVVEAMDLLVPGVGELIGGSAREHDFDVLYHRMEREGLLEELSWYLDLRRFGSVPHAGWGLGFERLLMLLTGLSNIRDVIPVPRHPGSCRY